ncbi:Gfo/Idh/MocA family oxidoreductase [Actinomadura sp. WMMB 499]|nr:Gfo/Idh/MocA family oxidoreductase [Actinomadura sp. WMMB 499]
MGVVGCADIAVRRMLPVMAGTDAVDLVAVAARDADRAAAVAARFGCAAEAGYEALLERDDIDAVYVPLPPALHHAWTRRALEAGKHVLAEKPLCVDAVQTAELVELARRRDLALVENFMFLHHSQHRAVRDLVEQGEIGTLRTLSSSFGIPPLDPGSYRYDPELGGGALLDVGVYPLRAAQLYLPGELAVLGACLRLDPATGVDVAGSVLLCSPDGVTAQLDFGFEHAYRSDCALWGDRGLLRVPRAFTPPEHHRPLVRIEQQDRVTELSLPPDHQVRNAIEAFAAAARSGGRRAGTAAPILRQAVLVERVRDAARIVE